MHRYSSVSAFLAHYFALRKIPSAALGEDDRLRLDAIEKLLQVLRPEERAAIASEANDPSAIHHRERAARHLRRELSNRGVLDGR